MVELYKNNRGFRTATILVAAQALVMIFIAIFKIGGQDFITNLYDYASPVFAVIAAISVLWGWLTSNPKELSRRIWGYMALGLFLWAVAEILWIYYAILHQDNTPYPSPADFFWLVGYLPLFISLTIRWGSFQISLTARQWGWLVIINAVILAFSAVYIYSPMFQDADPERWLETMVNVLYTSADLVLLAISQGIFFLLHKGRFSFVWNMILIANILMAIADLLFTYASWNESALSENTFYFLYVVFSLLYLNSYIFRALGMYINHLLLPEVRQNSLSQETKKNTALGMAVLFTNAENNVITTSQNFAKLAGVNSSDELKGQPLHQLLGVDAGEITNMISTGMQKGYINNYPIKIRTNRPDPVKSMVTATMEGWGSKTFNGLNMVLRFQAGDLLLDGLDRENSAIAHRVLIDTGENSRENIIQLKEYFNALVPGLFNLINTLSGKAVARGMVDQFNKAAVKNYWDIEFSWPDVLVSEEYKEDQLGRAFKQLLVTFKKYAVNVTNSEVVADEIARIEKLLGSRTIQAADDFGLRDL